MKAMKSGGLSRVFKLGRKTETSDLAGEPVDIPIPTRSYPSGSPEAAAIEALSNFCTADAGSTDIDPAVFLPTVVESCESSPTACAEIAHLLTEYLSKNLSTRPEVQYKATMVLRILIDNQGVTFFARNLDKNFAASAKSLLRSTKNPNARILLIETLEKLDSLYPRGGTEVPAGVAMWRREKEKDSTGALYGVSRPLFTASLSYTTYPLRSLRSPGNSAPMTPLIVPNAMVAPVQQYPLSPVSPGGYHHSSSPVRPHIAFDQGPNANTPQYALQPQFFQQPYQQSYIPSNYPASLPVPTATRRNDYFYREHAARHLPTPTELASRLEEAQNSAKLLSQCVANSEAAELLDSDLVKEFATRCKSAAKSIQTYMNATDPAPDNATMEKLLDTNEQLQTALSLHQRAALSARKRLGIDSGAQTPRVSEGFNRDEGPLISPVSEHDKGSKGFQIDTSVAGGSSTTGNKGKGRERRPLDDDQVSALSTESNDPFSDRQARGNSGESSRARQRDYFAESDDDDLYDTTPRRRRDER